jgi:type II secretory pathway pseudopilin PulG
VTPLVTGYLDQARTTRATADARSIADSIKLYQRDVGKYPIFVNAAEANADTPSSAFIATSNGASPTDGIGGGAWTTGLSGTSLELYMNANYVGRPTTVSVGRTFFNGPYIGNVDADPWGNKYYVTAANLQDDSAYYGFIVSAGPDGALSTAPNQPKTSMFAVGGDDVVALVR